MSMTQTRPSITIELFSDGGERTYDEDDLVLGRSSACDIQVRLEDVSRQHARLYFDKSDGRWHVEDLGSLNGTAVNGEAIQDAVLRAGDVVQLGFGYASVKVVKV